MIGWLAGVGAAAAAGWTSEGATTAQSATYGAGSVALGAVIGLSLLWPASNRTSRKLGLMVLASSTTRMFTSLMAAVVILFVMKPQPFVLFAALGAAFILCLVAESVWATSALRRAAAGGENRSVSTPIKTGVSV